MKLGVIFLVVLLGSTSKTISQEVDTTVHVKSIYFGGGSYYIDDLQEHELYEWLDSFPQIEQYEVIIQSHTDNIGSIAFNQRLSELRSQSVYIKLMEYQVQPEAVDIVDFGEYLPTYRNDSYHGKLANRRADIILKPLSL